MDVQLPGIDGVEALNELLAAVEEHVAAEDLFA